VHTIEKYRRTGVATRMYTAAFNLIKEYYKASSITVSISASNKASICLHNKLGFRNTSKVSVFADFIFEADETMYSIWLSRLHPAKNTTIHLNLLHPMWIEYMHEIGEIASVQELERGLISRICLSEEQEQIFFDIIWSGNNAIGFAFYSIDGGIKNLIPPGYGYIMEFYLIEQWRNRGIASNTIFDICNNLKMLGCPKIYLTSIPQSERFWLNVGFYNCGLIDPDNNLPILIKD
jgi:ribosomal protein S18 acetylase RimI-like enzyme